MYPRPWFIKTLPSASLRVNSILSLRCSRTSHHSLFLPVTAYWFQQLLTSGLTSHSLEEERDSLSISSVERKGAFLFQKTLGNIFSHFIVYFGSWISPEPAAVTREWASWSGLRQSAPLPPTPAAEVGSVCPQSRGHSGSRRMGSCARKMIICKSHCELPLWLAWCVLSETSRLKFSQVHQIDNFLWDFFLNYFEVHWVLSNWFIKDSLIFSSNYWMV